MSKREQGLHTGDVVGSSNEPRWKVFKVFNPPANGLLGLAVRLVRGGKRLQVGEIVETDANQFGRMVRLKKNKDYIKKKS